jgi:hypothetical protein
MSARKEEKGRGGKRTHALLVVSLPGIVDDLAADDDEAAIVLRFGGTDVIEVVYDFLAFALCKKGGEGSTWKEGDSGDGKGKLSRSSMLGRGGKIAPAEK